MIVRSKSSLSVACIVAGFVAAVLFLDAGQLSAAAESPTTLDQWLAQAMDKNPGILASKAKVAMAEAELKSVRFEVARQVVACWNEIDDQQRAIALAEEQIKVAEHGPPDDSKAHVAKSALIDLKAKLARAQSELQFLGGQAPPASPASLTSSSTAATVQAPLQLPHGWMVEKIRKLLHAPTTIEFVETPLKDVFDYLKDYHHIEIQLDDSALPAEKQSSPMTMNLSGVSLAAALQRMEDNKFGELKFVVRDYGILVTTPTRAKEAGYMPALEFARVGTGGTGAELTEARKRLAELVKVLEAGGTEAELTTARARLYEFMYVWDEEASDPEWMEAMKRLAQHGRKVSAAKGTPAAAQKPNRAPPQTAAPLGKEPRNDAADPFGR
ncbi:MAG: hypothetical protein ACLP9L_25165 [Thermoguttaceae bacterium]